MNINKAIEEFREVFVREPIDWREHKWAVPFVDTQAEQIEKYIRRLLTTYRDEIIEKLNGMKAYGDYHSDMFWSHQVDQLIKELYEMDKKNTPHVQEASMDLQKEEV